MESQKRIYGIVDFIFAFLGLGVLLSIWSCGNLLPLILEAFAVVTPVVRCVCVGFHMHETSD